MRIATVAMLFFFACGGDSAGNSPDAADGSGSDAAQPVDRYIFLLPAGPALFDSAAAADDACTQAAADASLGPSGASYHALLQFRDPAPTAHDRDPLTGVDRVLLPTQTVVATGSEFWGPHTVPINQLADATAVPSHCVFTAFKASGERLSADSGDCGEWASVSLDTLYAGITESFDSSGLAWAYGAALTCDQMCHVYCLQQ